MKVNLKRINGVMKVVIDEKIYEPLSFKSFRPSARNISDFAKAGIKLFSLLVSGLNCAYNVPYSTYGECWFGKGEYNFEAVDSQIELFRKNAPDCYYCVMIHLDTRDWWHKSHPDFPSSFTHLSQAAADPEWKEETAAYLRAMISHIEEKYSNCIYGYYILGGRGTEWFSEFDNQASHPIKEKYFREYTGNPDATIPSQEELELPSEMSFYTDSNVKTYQRAHAELITDTVLYFAKEAQKVIKHKKLLGLYFGYLLEFRERLWNSGHLDYERIFASDDIDMISSPASYDFRSPDSTSAFMLMHKSLDIHNKLYFYEYDQRTYLSHKFAVGDGGYFCKTDDEAVDLMHRDFMLCETNGAALWWFDMFEGWYSTVPMMEGIRHMIQIHHRLSDVTQHSVAEVALIGSPESFYSTNKTTVLSDYLLSSQREGYMKLGAPFDMYSVGDLKDIDISRHKLFVFLCPFDISPKQETTINTIKASGKTILWIYAPGYVNGGIEKMRKITDMNISISDEKPASAQGGMLLPSPHFYISDTSANAISCFDNGSMAVGYKECEGYTSVYSAIGKLDAELLRRICSIAGVYIYSETHPVYVNNLTIGVYAKEATELNVRKDGVYEDLFTGNMYQSAKGKLYVPAGKYASKLLMRQPDEEENNV